MFWDKISPLYDLFENVYNGKVYSGTGVMVAEMISTSDIVLECACGTGAISRYIAPKCKRLIATDFSTGMLRQASKKCRRYGCRGSTLHPFCTFARFMLSDQP